MFVDYCGEKGRRDHLTTETRQRADPTLFESLLCVDAATLAYFYSLNGTSEGIGGLRTTNEDDKGVDFLRAC